MKKARAKRKHKKNASSCTKGRKFGEWSLNKKIGVGGNGEVWEVTRKGVEKHAIKILKKVKKETYDRFKFEMAALSDNSDIEGIIPLVDKHDVKSDLVETPWFVMPVAQKFHEFIQNKSPVEIATEFVSLATTLEELHSRGISHRDIKPANILYWQGRLNFSDFGLVKYPTREDVTPRRQDVGPKFTMAPEMRRYASESDGLAADVYSFSKTLWIALTGETMGFDGQYSTESVLSIKNYHSSLYTTKLDNLLSEATDNDPKKRPSISEFKRVLREWIELINDFHTRNLTEWFEIQNILFPRGAPKSSCWTDIDSIISVLKEVSQIRALNHMFYPGGGGNTITDVSRASEEGLIALHVDELIDLLKPKKLTYESFGLDPEWNYFRLEAEEIPLIGIENAVSFRGFSEVLTEIEPGNYVSYDCWESNEFEGKPLPDSARPISRYFDGSFVFFCTRSTYNGDTSTYDGRHNKMSEDEFRTYIDKNANQIA